MFGAVGGVLPLRLGGTAENGWTAAQHARVAADLVAVNRTMALARFTVTAAGLAGSVGSYVGRNGVGAAFAPDLVESPALGVVTLRWSPNLFPDPYDTTRALPVTILGVRAKPLSSTDGWATWTIEGVPAKLTIRMFNSAGGLADGSASVVVYGTLGDSARRAIGDYAGDPDKEDSKTEGQAPYAEFILRELRAQRGASYSQKAGTLVDAENLALARFFAAVGPRNAEKFRANRHPATSDERLPYWEELLALPFAPGEPKWSKRRKLAAHAKVSEGPTIGVVRTRLAELLGDVFVDVSTSEGASLASPPTLTFWPGVNPGPAEYSLGGGCWASERDHYFVQVQQPAGMSEGEFLQLVNVQLFALLDDLLPATSTFSWGLGGGFFLDISRLDFTGMTP